MKRISYRIRVARPIALIGSVAALTVAFAVAPAQAGRIHPPPVPGEIVMPDDVKPFLEGHATGTQNYVCLPSGATFAWSLFTPQATLFDDHRREITTHFFGLNPEEPGVVRAAWQTSRDTSTVWGAVDGQSSDARFVAPDAIAWLRVIKKGTLDGPRGGDTLSVTTHIHRVNTAGGLAPATGCASPADVGKRAFVPYKADYIFYRSRTRDDDEEDEDSN